MLFVDLWQSPILGFTHYETCLPYKQIVISMGHGANAALGAFDYLIKN